MAIKPNQNHKNVLVVRHNKLIESKYFLSLSERRFILWLISQIKRNDEDFRVYIIGVKEWREFVGLKPNEDLYNEVRKMAKSLIERSVEIRSDNPNDNKSFGLIPWFHRINYKAGTGTIEAILHPDLKPFLLQLKEQYTAITLEYALLLKSGYAHRIYDFLKQYQSVRSRTILLSSLREMMEIKKQEYPRYADFRRWVLETAQKEINQKTDLSFTFQPVKEGRKITAIFFEIQTTRPMVTLENQEETDPRAHAIFQALTKHGVAEKTARELIADYDTERIEWHIKEFEKRKKANKAESAGWIVQGIKEDYRHQPSFFEQEEEKKRKKTKAKRERRERLNAEIDRLKIECDEHNRQSGKAFLDGLPEKERSRLDQEFLQKYSSIPGIGRKFQKEGLKSHWALVPYLLFLREKYPKSGLSYLEYAKAHKASKEVIEALKSG